MPDPIPMDTEPVSKPLDLDAIRSKISELEDIYRTCNDEASELPSSDSEELLKDCSLDFQRRVKKIMSEYSDFGSDLGLEDLDACLERVTEELGMVGAENVTVSNEIEELTRKYVEDANILKSDLEGLECLLDYIESQGLEKAKGDASIDCTAYGDDQLNMTNVQADQKFEVLELDNQIEKNKIILKTLQDLDCIFKRFDAMELIEDALTGAHVIEFDRNCIRLSLRTYIPKLEKVLCQQNSEDIIVPSELNHELLIEVMDETLEVKDVEIFPNDVYIGNIVDATKSFRQLFSQLVVPETNSMQWFVRKVQDKIILSTLRQLVVKSANKSRYSLEYLDKEETIVAHMVGEVDAFIKVSHGWPALNSPLKLISLKVSNNCSKGISLSFLCKVEEEANSVDVHIRQNLPSFVDTVEKILVEQMRLELLSVNNPES